VDILYNLNNSSSRMCSRRL